MQQLKTESLIAELRELKGTKPSVQPPRHQERVQRYMKFEQENGISLKSQKRQKSSRQGLFSKTIFCFPLLDPTNDPSPDKLVQLAKGIYSQGGKIVQFNHNINNKHVQYILVDRKTDIGFVRQALKQRMIYLSIIDYMWVEESLRKFTRMDIAKYNLQTNNQNEGLNRQGKKRKQYEIKGEEDSRKRAIRDFTQSKIFKKKKLNDLGELKILSKAPNREVEMPKSKQQISTQVIPTKRHEINSDSQETVNMDENKDKTNIQKQNTYVKTQNQQGHHDSERSNSTQKTQQIDSDKETNKSTKTTTFDATSLPKTEIPDSPNQNSKKKTKLAIGSHQFNINNKICQKLKQMQEVYQTEGDRKSFAYLRAIACIRNYGKQITNANQLRNIDGLGAAMIEKVKQFLQTGSISKVDNRVSKNGSVPYRQLLKVFGIGPNTAEQLYHRGIRTISDLQKNQQLLNKSQKMGLRYVKELQQRIPRDKVSRMLQFVKKTLYYIVRSDTHHEVEAVGSYRRGKATCGDVDILITRKDGYAQKTLLQQLVNELEKRKFITDHITSPKNYEGHNSVNYMGVCLFEDNVHHRIDFKHYPVDQYAFALLYFTGSDLFNREMRMKAHQMGLMLNDHEIKRKERNGQGKVWKGGKIPVCYTEKDIFNVLEMQYRAPCQRQL